jgi:hypothetical protein
MGKKTHLKKDKYRSEEHNKIKISNKLPNIIRNKESSYQFFSTKNIASFWCMTAICITNFCVQRSLPLLFGHPLSDCHDQR